MNRIKSTLNLIWRILVVIYIIMIPSGTALADTQITINVTADPLISVGIYDFRIIYISDQQLDFEWGFSAGTSNIMIRGEYGEYPDNIVDVNTAPSDGYLIYYGNNTTASDTSMDFDLNPGPLYIRAWAQNIDGTWIPTPSEGWKESKTLLLLAFLGLFLGLIAINVMVKNSFTPTKLLAALAWVIPLIWILTSPPSPFDVGTNLHTAGLVIIIGGLLISCFSAFSKNTRTSSTLNSNIGMSSISRDHNEWKLPEWISGLKGQNYTEIRKKRQIDLSDYRERVHKSLYPRGEAKDRRRSR
jgi:hypothetical protein